MKSWKKALSLFLSLTLVFSLAIPAMAEEGGDPDAGIMPISEEQGTPVETAAEVTILYTNDVHTNIDKDITYSKLAAYKDSMENVLLVDAGDHAQGTVYGLNDKGETIIKLMNAAGYDAATLGNHEFDYKMEGTLNIIEWAEYPYLSCNFYHEGELMLKPYQIFEVNGKKVALVGITTPESIVKSTPKYFMDDAGNFIYTIAGGEDGAALYTAVQAAVDAATAEGADYIIGLAHLGIDEASKPWTSKDVIANTTGFTAFIDGHSHSVDPMETVADKAGKDVVLTQTGNYFDNVGKLTIDAEGKVTTALLTAEDLAALEPKAEVKAIEDTFIEKIKTEMGTVIGYAQVTFDNYEGDERLCRKQETNSGDFIADAYYNLFLENGVDVALINGGGVRNKAVTGELTMKSMQEFVPWANQLCMLEVTGQTLLDALEWGAQAVNAEGTAESGGFLHAAGLKYTIDASIPSTVQKDETGMWTGGPTGAYRVSNVQILDRETGVYEPLDLKATYNLAGIEYTLKDLGDGFAMFGDSPVITDGVSIDYLALTEYLKTFPANSEGLPTIGTDSVYADKNGNGRITIVGQAGPEKPEEPKEPEKPEEPAQPTVDPATVYTVTKGDSLWKIAKNFYGNGAKWNVIYEANKDTVKNPNTIYVGQQLVIPQV